MKLFIRNRHINLRFAILIAFSVVLMIVDHYPQGYLKPLRSTLAVVVAPIPYVVNWPAKMVEWTQDSFSSHQALLEDNANLRVQLLLLKAHLQKFITLQQQNAQLRALLQSSPSPDDKVLLAQLLAVDPDPFVQQVVLNKGSRAKAYLGQPVLDGSGVFGQIIEVGQLTSRVMLLTDTRSAIPVEDSRSGVRAIVVGKGEISTLSLVNMAMTADIKEGDLLVTSGLGEHFPVGYPVGTITSIVKSPGSAFANVMVKPSAHLYRSHLVLLIWPGIRSS